MEKHTIEDYRGFTIYYDEDRDKFCADMEFGESIRNAKRGSLKDIKHDIDVFIKENKGFKPFSFILKSSWGDSFKLSYCSAIRSDGCFVVSDDKESKYKSYLKLKDMELACNLDNKLLEKYEAAKVEFELSRKKYDSIEKQIYKNLVQMDLSDFKK